MRQVDWSDLRLFLAFVRGGNMRIAGRMLGISHSTVARRIDQLEQQAGAALYERRASQLFLSATGRDLLETAERVEEEVLDLERRSFGRNRDINGPLTLTTVDALAIEPFFDELARFRVAYPQTDLRLVATMSLADLDRGEADLALRFGQSPAEHLVGRRLTPTARAVYAAPSYLEKHMPRPELTGGGWISFSPHGAPETWKSKTPYPTLPTVLRCGDMRSQQAACRSGLGMALLPCFLCDPDPALVRLSDPECVPRQELWLLRHADARGNVRVRALTEHLVGSVARLSPLLLGETAKTQSF